MNMQTLRSLGHALVLRLWPVLLLLALWQTAALSGWADPALMPAPSRIAARLLEQLQSSEFLFHVGQTLLRLFAGFALALAVGIGLGMASGSRGEALIMPLVRLLAPVPKIALYPALVLLLGYSHASKVALVMADAVFPILLATLHGLRSVQPKLLWSAQAAGAGPAAQLLTVSLPAALPSILTGCRIGLVIACLNVFLAEMISSTDGLGHVLVVAARSYQIVDMFVPLLLISAIGLVLAALLQGVARRLPSTASV